jgi:predicted metal-binding protein
MRNIVVCTTCKFSTESRVAVDGRTGGEILIAHLNDAMQSQGRNETVVKQSCLWNCSRPCSVLIRDTSRFSYITGGHEPSLEQANAILQWYDLHGQTDKGDVSFRAWPERMRGHFIARIPPVTP